MSRRTEAEADAAAGKLGALRWALMQRSGKDSANHLLIIMGGHGNGKFECWAAVGKLAAEMECTTRTVQRLLRHLEHESLIRNISHRRRRRTTTYLLCAPCVSHENVLSHLGRQFRTHRQPQ